MSEMLGNQYFMARNYVAALDELEEVYLKDPQNKSVMRKLIICNSQTGQINKSFELFTQLVKNDIEFIINADPVNDDCPCQELIQKYENNEFCGEDTTSIESIINCGIIWLFCDVHKSLEFFLKANTLNQNAQGIKIVIDMIENYLAHSLKSKS